VKSQTQPIRIVVADDVPEILDVVTKRLAPEYTVIGRVGDGEALVESVLKLSPELIITDVSMPKLTGIEAMRRLRKLGVQIPAVILTVHDDEDIAREALSLGVQGYVLKHRLVSDLPVAAREALRGRTFVSEAVHKEMSAGDPAAAAPRRAATAGLESDAIVLDRIGLFIAKTEGIEWQDGDLPGCQKKILFIDERHKCVTSLVRMEAAARFPAHRHGGPEEVFVLHGDLVVEGHLMNPGDYCRAETESIHSESYTQSGCIFLLRSSQHDQIMGDSAK
jgi:DNA-binding NarL/FixJ family response regulator